MLSKKQCKITRRASLKEEEAPGDMPHSGNERPRVKDRSVRVQGAIAQGHADQKFLLLFSTVGSVEDSWR